ncbi:hypothetical protein Tco_0127240 [Tanacetum coccineum]
MFVDLTHNDTKTPSPKLQLSSPSAPNAPFKTPSTKDTSSSSIDYIPKSPTSSTLLSPIGYLNPPTSPPPKVSPPPLTQKKASMDITLTLSPITPLNVQFTTPSPSPPIVGHPIPCNLHEAHGDSLKTQEIQAGVQVSRPEDTDDIFDIGSALEDIYFVVFVLGRNIITYDKTNANTTSSEAQRGGPVNHLWRESDGNRSGQDSTHKSVIVGVSRDLRGISEFSVPRSLPCCESLGKEENVGFELDKCFLCPSFIERGNARGVGIRVVNSYTSNHREDDFTPLETIQRFLGVIGSRSLSSSEGMPSSRIRRRYGGKPMVELYRGFFNLFMSGHVQMFKLSRILILFLFGLKLHGRHGQQWPAVFVEMAFRNFMYAEDDEDLSFLPCELSPSFGTVSPSTSINNEPPLLEAEPFDMANPDVVERMKSRKCRTKGSIKPHVKRKLRGNLDNYLDDELLDLHDRCYARQAVVDNVVNQRARELLKVVDQMKGECDVLKEREKARDKKCEEFKAKCEAAMEDFDNNPAVNVLRKKIKSLSDEVKEHKAIMSRMLLESLISKNKD